METKDVQWLIKRYLDVEKLFQEFFAAWNYCATKCHVEGNVGCCDFDHFRLGYNLGKDFVTRFEAQRDKLYGRRPSLTERQFPCFYSSCQGCKLKTHRAPKCYAYICVPMRDELRKKYGIEIDYEQMMNCLERILSGELLDSEFSFLKQKIEAWVELIVKIQAKRRTE